MRKLLLTAFHLIVIVIASIVICVISTAIITFPINTIANNMCESHTSWATCYAQGVAGLLSINIFIDTLLLYLTLLIHEYFKKYYLKKYGGGAFSKFLASKKIWFIPIGLMSAFYIYYYMDQLIFKVSNNL